MTPQDFRWKPQQVPVLLTPYQVDAINRMIVAATSVGSEVTSGDQALLLAAQQIILAAAQGVPAPTAAASNVTVV